MRRTTYFGLAAGLLALVLYSAFWFIVAGRIEDGFGAWARSLRAQNLDLTWRGIRVAGFPAAFRIELSEARLRGVAAADAGAVQVPLLAGSARPWNFRVWHLAAPDGLSAMAGSPDRPQATLHAASAAGSVALGAEGGAAAWLDLDAPAIDTGTRFAARDAELWLSLPKHPPRTHGEKAIGVALDIRGLTLPVAPAPFRNPLDDIAFGVTLFGPVPAAPPREAAAAWRDAGGILDLDHLAAHWGVLAMTGSGTLALDRQLQPIGSFSGAIEGYGELLEGLVAAGQLRLNEARIAQLALAMLAKTGPDGKPRLATSFTLQDGEMYLGPVKLGKAPRIEWP